MEKPKYFKRTRDTIDITWKKPRICFEKIVPTQNVLYYVLYYKKKEQYFGSGGKIYNFLEAFILWPLLWLTITLLGGVMVVGIFIMFLSLIDIFFFCTPLNC